MIIGLRTRAQAARVAALTGCARLPGRPGPDGSVALSRFVDAGPDFEAHRAAVESVSVLFTLHEGDAAGGSPGSARKTGRRQRRTAAREETTTKTAPAAAAEPRKGKQREAVR